jgi:dipeptidyl aminopeptidase/acylaminoacyl peptidase
MATVRALLAIAALASTALAQGEIKPPTSVVHEGIPFIPASLAREADPYRTFYGSSLCGWNPAKDEAIVIGYNREASMQAARVAGPGQTPEFFTNLPRGFRESYVDPQGKYILYLKPVDDNFQSQFYRYDIATKSSELLTDGKSKNLYPVFSNSGKLLAYSSTRRNGSDLDVYVMDPLDPKTNRLVAELSGNDWAPFDWSPDDTKLVLSDYRASDETYLWLLDLKTGKKTLLTPPDGGLKAFNGSVAYFSRDGKGLFISTDRGSEFRRLAYIDIATRSPKYLGGTRDWDIDEFALSPDRKNLAFVTNEDGIGRIHLMNADTFKEQPVAQMPAGVISGLKWHPSQPLLGFVFSSTKNPQDIFALNSLSGKIERWTTAPVAVKTEPFNEPELIKWQSFDKRAITGFLYRPPASFTGKRPVMIYLHGGLHDQFRPDFRGQDNYFINSLGIAVIYPNIRGSSGYGKTFLSLNHRLLRLDAIRDIGALLDWIAERPDLDAARVLVAGESAGAYDALSAAEMYPDRISAALSYVGPTNLATLIERTVNNNPDPWRRLIGDERDKATRAFLDKIAPVTNANKIAKPTFLIIGGRDLMTSAVETRHIVDQIRLTRTPAWFLLAEQEGHGFLDPSTYEYTFLAQVLFIEQFLLGEKPGADVINQHVQH